MGHSDSKPGERDWSRGRVTRGKSAWPSQFPEVPPPPRPAESGRTRPPRPAWAAASPWTRSTRTAGRRTARPPPAPPWPPRWPRARRRTGTPSSLRAQGLLSAHSRPQRSGAGTFWNQARAAGRPHPAGQPCPRGPGCWTGRRQAAPGARGSLTDSGYAFCRNRGPSRQEWILTRPPRRLLLTQGAGQRDLPRGPETVSPRGHDRKGAPVPPTSPVLPSTRERCR